MKEYITIDIGDTQIRFGIVNEDAVLTYHDRIPLSADNAQEIVPTVLDLIEELRERCTPEGVCLATVGLVDITRGVVFYAPDHLPGYAGAELKKLVESGCSLPCEVERSVICASYAEYASGAALHAASLFLMTVGLAIEGCIMTDGDIWRGQSLSACGIGHLPMYGSTFETLASTAALSRKVAAIKGMLGLNWDVKRIFKEAQSGDKECARAIDDMCDVLGRGIATVCSIINPEVVVLGGEIMTWHTYLMPRIRACTEKYLIDPVSGASFIASSSHMEQAAMIGAYLHYRKMRQP